MYVYIYICICIYIHMQTNIHSIDIAAYTLAALSQTNLAIGKCSSVHVARYEFRMLRAAPTAQARSKKPKPAPWGSYP